MKDPSLVVYFLDSTQNETGKTLDPLCEGSIILKIFTPELQGDYKHDTRKHVDAAGAIVTVSSTNN
jgi:hypothetical protein